MQRKQFRIEEMGVRRRLSPAGARAAAASRTGSPLPAHELAQELTTLRETIANNVQELAALLNEGRERRMARAASELGAAVEVMEKSTDKILKSAEVIDDHAKTLSMSLQNDYKSGLAHDILDHLTSIYEACNFQDLAGQRIGKVIGTLGQIEDTVTRMLARCQNRSGDDAVPAAPARGGELLNGPRLDGDPGHASQGDIDALFA
ncbi:MAG TPA: protein phosphatase CheZ [Pseudolabrys sp.]|nr:protein phosphatase CheZ [Pseudolabrys sp.]